MTLPEVIQCLDRAFESPKHKRPLSRKTGRRRPSREILTEILKGQWTDAATAASPESNSTARRVHTRSELQTADAVGPREYIVEPSVVQTPFVVERPAVVEPPALVKPPAVPRVLRVRTHLATVEGNNNAPSTRSRRNRSPTRASGNTNDHPSLPRANETDHTSTRANAKRRRLEGEVVSVDDRPHARFDQKADGSTHIHLTRTYHDLKTHRHHLRDPPWSESQTQEWIFKVNTLPVIQGNVQV
jgi:hypothetical protein